MTHAAIYTLNFSDKDVLRRTSRQNITIASHGGCRAAWTSLAIVAI